MGVAVRGAGAGRDSVERCGLNAEVSKRGAEKPEDDAWAGGDGDSAGGGGD